MKNRREFIKKAGLASLALPIIGSQISWSQNIANSLKEKFTLNEFGIQLWTVRDFMAKDAKGTLKSLGEYGYKTIESFQGEQGVFWGMSPAEFKSFLSGHGMTCLSTHCDPQYTMDPKKLDEFKKLTDDANIAGLQYLLNPYLGFLKTKDDYKKAADSMNALGEICKSKGLSYGYHNHHYSFVKLDGEYPQDIMMKATAGGPVVYEMDMYWVAAAGQDPKEWFKKYPGQFELGHVKDRYGDAMIKEIMLKEKADSEFGVDASCVLGKGSMNFDELLLVAKENGMKHLYR
ncbi:MAG: sugar phosphate isomerase/epimerase [Flavobacteriaceae bacterium]|nr:sugar phosphate isomerase/epimerase [Flavobacteriaceae bacterium]